MGQSYSAPSAGSDKDKSVSLPPTTSSAKVHYQPPALPTPTVVGIEESDRRRLILAPKLAARLANVLPPSCQSNNTHGGGGATWYLLYSSDLNGKSFQRLVQHITAKGPTLVVVKLKDTARVIGAFCESDWLTVGDREKSAKSAAAASARAAREGQKQRTAAAPSNQNNVFFGSDNCFVFRANDHGGDGVSEEGEIYRSNPSMNSNFMYLFDTHPLEEKVGIGMGGQPGYYGWFIDRWLENGASYGARCTTFQCPRLTPTESWIVEAVEVYAVKEDIVRQLVQSGTGGVSGVSCVNGSPDSKVDQMLLELNGTHEFNNHERGHC